MPSKKQPAGRSRAPSGYDFSAFGGGALAGITGPSAVSTLSRKAEETKKRPRGASTISEAPKAKGVLTRYAADAVRGLSRAFGSSERDAAQRASRFEELNQDYNPLSSADMVGTQLRRLTDGDRDFDKGALAQGALGTALTVAPEIAAPAAKALAKSKVGQKVVGALSKVSPIVEDDAIEGTAKVVSSARKPAPRSTPDVRTKDGAVVTPRAAQPGVLSSPGKARPLTDEVVDLTHFSHEPALTRTDPSKFGSNPKRITGRGELSRAGVNKRTYFGVDVGKPGGYKKEGGVGPFEYQGQLPKSTLMEVGGDYFKSMQNAAREIMKSNDTRFGQFGPNGQVLMDTLAKNSGFKGVLYPPEYSSLGKIAQVFDPVDVSRVTPTVPADFLPQNIGNAMTRDDWAIATGANPMGRSLPDEANIARNQRFELDAQGLGANTYPVAGKYGNEEQSFLVSPVTQDQAIGLGSRYEQDSVLTNRGLLYHDGTLTPAQGAGAVPKDQDDFFSTMAVPGEKEPTRFAVDLGDFDRFPDPQRATPAPRQTASPGLDDLDARTLRILQDMQR